MILILYGVLTENSIITLFIASVLPGLLATLLYVLAVLLVVAYQPSLAPIGEATTLRERLATVRGAGRYCRWHLLSELASTPGFSR